MQPDMNCSLLSNGLGIPLQFVLVLLAMTSLLIKRRLEIPARPWPVWARDTSKQVLSTAFGHGCNIFLALQLRAFGDECIWYFINFIADNTLGVLFNYLLLVFFTRVYQKRFSDDLFTPGVYEHPRYSIGTVWAFQVIEWICIVLLVKFTIYIMLLRPLGHSLNALGEYVFSSFDNSPKELLIMVMVIVPTLLNALQFWIQDSFLKHKEGRGRSAEERVPFLSH